MAWVNFKRKYNWRVPGKGVSFLSYPPGKFSVKRKCADDAIAAGAAEALSSPTRDRAPAAKAGAKPAEAADGARSEGV